MEMSLQVERDIARKKKQDQNDDVEVAPLASCNNFAGSRRSDEQQEACVDKHCRQPSGLGRKRHADAAGEPEHDEAKKGRTLNRQTPGPVWNRGEQKTGDNCRKVAVEHFMDMPVAWREGCGQSEFAGKDREPDKDRETRIDRAVS